MADVGFDWRIATVTRLGQLGKDSVVYGLGALIAKSIGFVLLPVITRIFTPAEFGVIEMLSAIAALLSALMVMGMDSAQSFYFFEQRTQGQAAQARLVSAVLQWRIVGGGVIVLVATLAAPLFNAAFFDGHLSALHFAAAFGAALFMQLMSQSVDVFRLLYRPWPYVLVTLAQSLAAAGLMLWLVLAFDLGVLGYFLGSLLACIGAAAVGWYAARDYLDFSALHLAWWPRLLRFGAPLVPAGVAMYVMNTADRWFIQHYHGEAALGVYAVGAKFALVMALAIETFRKAWWPIAMDAMHSDDGPETFRMISRLFMGVGVAAVVYLAFLSPWLVRWLTGPAFHDGWTVVGVLAWQSLFYGFYLVASAGIWKAEKTPVAMVLLVGAALLNAALNWLFVPALGGLGAALATAFAYLAWIALSLVVSERMWPVGFPIPVLALQVAAGALAVACVTLLGSASWWTVACVHVVVALLLLTARGPRTVPRAKPHARETVRQEGGAS
jgi:O-antigen/teichoic acid export membrane protein